MEQNLKIVDFNWYCPRCIHWDVAETEDPCNACLTQSFNENSRKPINYIEGDNKNGERKDTGR